MRRCLAARAYSQRPEPPVLRVVATRLRRLLAYPDRQGDGSYFLRFAPKIFTLKPLDRLDFRRAWAAPTAGNRIASCPAVSPPIVRQNRRYAGRCPAPRPRTKNRIFYRPSSRWRSRFLSCSDMPRIRSALFFAVISSIIFALACFSSG